jgi:hypothetical protein
VCWRVLRYFKTDEELREFMEYFKDTLPDPEHHPHKVMWLVAWWGSIIKRKKPDANLYIQK